MITRPSKYKLATGYKPAKFSLFAVCCLLLCTQPGAQCVSDDSGSTGNNPPPRRDDSYRNEPSSNDRLGDRPVNRLEIDRQAEVDRDYRPGDFEWRSPASGQIWVYDLDRREVIDSTFVRRGEVLKVGPEADRIWVDGDTRSRNRIREDSRHRIYILPDDPRQYERERYRGSDRPTDERPRDERPRDDRLRDERPEQGPNRPTQTSDIRGLPEGARQVAQGTGSALIYDVTRDGKIFVVDVQGSRIVKSFDVSRTQKVILDPSKGHVTRDSKKMIEGIDRRKAYRLYFQNR